MSDYPINPKSEEIAKDSASLRSSQSETGSSSANESRLSNYATGSSSANESRLSNYATASSSINESSSSEYAIGGPSPNESRSSDYVSEGSSTVESRSSNRAPDISSSNESSQSPFNSSQVNTLYTGFKSITYSSAHQKVFVSGNQKKVFSVSRFFHLKKAKSPNAMENYPIREELVMPQPKYPYSSDRYEVKVDTPSTDNTAAGASSGIPIDDSSYKGSKLVVELPSKSKGFISRQLGSFRRRVEKTLNIGRKETASEPLININTPSSSENTSPVHEEKPKEKDYDKNLGL